LRETKRRSNPGALGDSWIASSPYGRLAMTLIASPACGRRVRSVIARSEATKQSRNLRLLVDCFVALRAPRNDADRISRKPEKGSKRHCEKRSDEAIREPQATRGLLRRLRAPRNDADRISRKPEKGSKRHCEKRSDEASRNLRRLVDCFVALRAPRNDADRISRLREKEARSAGCGQAAAYGSVKTRHAPRMSMTPRRRRRQQVREPPSSLAIATRLGSGLRPGQIDAEPARWALKPYRRRARQANQPARAWLTRARLAQIGTDRETGVVPRRRSSPPIAPIERERRSHSALARRL
jgi:hypothetical protein